MQASADLRQIERTVDDYFRGMYEGDVARLRSAFDEGASLFGYFRGKRITLPVDAWLKAVAAGPSPASQGELFDMKLLSADVAGHVACVKVADLYQGLRYTDYLTMIERDGRWVIVSKAFHHEPT